jgi:hypothetical protein
MKRKTDWVQCGLKRKLFDNKARWPLGKVLPGDARPIQYKQYLLLDGLCHELSFPPLRSRLSTPRKAVVPFSKAHQKIRKMMMRLLVCRIFTALYKCNFIYFFSFSFQHKFDMLSRHAPLAPNHYWSCAGSATAIRELRPLDRFLTTRVFRFLSSYRSFSSRTEAKASSRPILMA